LHAVELLVRQTLVLLAPVVNLAEVNTELFRYLGGTGIGIIRATNRFSAEILSVVIVLIFGLSGHNDTLR
jgi:hypothetical protein